MSADASAALEFLVQRGLLRRVRADPSLASARLLSAAEDLVDAHRPEIQPRNRFRIACNAACSSSEALLVSYGYSCEPSVDDALQIAVGALFTGTPAAMFAVTMHTLDQRRLETNDPELQGPSDLQFLQAVDDVQAMHDAICIQVRTSA